MSNKFTDFIIFGLLGVVISLILPIWRRKYFFTETRTRPNVNFEEPIWVPLCFGITLALLFLKLSQALPWTYTTVGALLSTIAAFSAYKYRLRVFVSICLGLLIATVLPWWVRNDSWGLLISEWKSIKIILLMALVYWMLQKKSLSEQQTTKTNIYVLKFIYFSFVVSVVFFTFLTGLSLAIADVSAWHHWGAFIGPAQLILAGAFPLHDIPLQYGLGSALILSLGCKVDCWMTMYWLSSLTSAALTLAVASIALQLNQSKHPLSIAATLVIVMVSCLFWTAYPPDVSGSLATPSTSGLRFLPGVLMLTLVLSLSKRSDFLPKFIRWGHILWLVCISWSPEAGIHATTVWVPYFVLTQSFKNNAVFSTKNFFRSVSTLALVFLIGLIVFALIYRTLFGLWPLPLEYFAYILDVPGATPIKMNGAIWFAIACITSWLLVFTFIRNSNTPARDIRASWVVALLCFANFTYYLGRSHDNNILNLMPYLSLLLFATRGICPPGALKNITTTLLSAVIGYTLIFGWMTWTDAYQQGRLFEFSPKKLIESFNRENNKNYIYKTPFLDVPISPTDAASALQYIHTKYNESVVVLDHLSLINSGEKNPYWSVMQVPTNFLFLPSNIRREYLSRVAKRINRSGWVIYKGDYEEILSDYDTVYNRVEQFDFGTYKAIRYTPK